MSKFTFICEDEPLPFSDGVVTKRTFEFDACDINDIVSEFELFLRGAGFNPTGTLEFISDTGTEIQRETQYNKNQPANPENNFVYHTTGYFDTERNR